MARRLARVLSSLSLFPFFWLHGSGFEAGKKMAAPRAYVGPQACVECHARRVEQVLNSNHASTWAPSEAIDRLEVGPQEITVDGITYGVAKENGRWVYRLQLPGRPLQTFAIHSVLGGQRLGVALILEVEELEGRKLPRPALVEARYMFSPREPIFRLAPGFPGEKPRNYGNAIGHVLSPSGANKCLNCHGGIRDSELAKKGGPHPLRVVPGVTCESCHGPASAHLQAARAKEADLKILHPGRLSNSKLHEICAPCHTGFFPREQPRPGDLQVANQLTALVNSECYIQSGEGLSCLTCHNPHANARPRGRGYDVICQECHSSEEEHEVQCPVSPRKECIHCHMPEIVLPEDFHVTDHWIRVVEP